MKTNWGSFFFLSDNWLGMNVYLLPGNPFLWVEIFVDAYGYLTTTTRSTCGVYISFSNIRTRFKHSGNYIRTHTLLPPGIVLADAMKPLKDELKELEQMGFEVPMYPDGKTIRVYGATSFLISDHPQACFNCSHLGNNEKKNCRMCTIDISKRSKCDIKLLDFEHTRREAQSDVIRTQLQDELGVNPPDSLVSKACTKYGISNVLPPFHGIADSHQQSFVCIGHAIDVGLLRRLVNFMMTKVRPIHHEVLTIRLKHLELPRGWIPFGSHFLNFKGKFSQPIIAVRKLTYFTNCLFGGWSQMI